MRKLLLLAFLSLASTARAETISFTMEEYPPFNYRDGKEIKGAFVEEVEKMMATAGIDYTIDVMPWARAYMTAQTTPMTCVIGTAHRPDRDKLFTWVEPLMIDRNILIRHSGSSVTASNLDEARHYTVGTWRDDYTETLLRDAKFPKIDVGNDFKTTLKKLMNDRIDLIPMSEFYYLRLKREGSPIEKVATLAETPLGVACQKDLPEPLKHKMQAALDQMLEQGQDKPLFAKYGLDGGN